MKNCILSCNKMSLLKLKSVPCILIADDANKNILPLLLEISSGKSIKMFCFEQPAAVWEKVYENQNIQCYEDFDSKSYNKYLSDKSTVIIDSVNEMSLFLGWFECYKTLKRFNQDSNVEKLIIILHKDCLTHSSKLYTYIDHFVNATISYCSNNSSTIKVKIKKGNKVVFSEENLSYDDRNQVLKSTPIIKQEISHDEPEKPSPASLTTFKIEVDQIDKMEKSKLQLPYMSKIHEGESKVIYEPDAVDDWDEEDPDEDLDI